jgi:light-harvesting protein B-800-850 alpha chain
MNQGRIWCVVSPNVGLPLLLGSVAVTSLIVHACVMTHTPWMSSYWSGSWRNRTSEIDSPSKVADATDRRAPYSLTVTPVPGVPGKSDTSFVVSVKTNPGAEPIEAAAGSPESRPPGPLASAAPAE